MNKNIFLILISLMTCGLSTAFAATQSHESLKTTALTFLQNETKDIQDSEITIRPLDRRLRLHQCSTALEAFWPLENKKIGNTTVGIRCNGDKPWKIFIGANIHIYKYVWVSKTRLNRNQLIALENIHKEKRDITKLTGGYLTAESSILGKQIKRNISANQVLTDTMLDSQKIVRRGDRITIISKYGGIEVRAVGVALSDGSQGDRIRVKNTASKREIEAYISDKHKVLVPL